MNDDPLNKIAEKLQQNPAVTVLTGAGVSAGSGIPTFRGDDGLWKGNDPRELASPKGFRADPGRVWKWYDERRQTVDEAQPNRAHEIMGQWSREFNHFQLITQNVDDLHERADTRNIIKLHGSIWHVKCWEGCAESPNRWEFRTVPLEDLPPNCPHCGGLVRPDVVWFGETLPPGVIESARRATHCDLFFTIGTSAEVHPAAGFISEARRQGALTIEINPNPTAASSTVDLTLQDTAESTLSKIEKRRDDLN